MIDYDKKNSLYNALILDHQSLYYFALQDMVMHALF